MSDEHPQRRWFVIGYRAVGWCLVLAMFALALCDYLGFRLSDNWGEFSIRIFSYGVLAFIMLVLAAVRTKQASLIDAALYLSPLLAVLILAISAPR